jgi:hypothetical protein
LINDGASGAVFPPPTPVAELPPAPLEAAPPTASEEVETMPDTTVVWPPRLETTDVTESIGVFPSVAAIPLATPSKAVTTRAAILTAAALLPRMPLPRMSAAKRGSP